MYLVKFFGSCALTLAIVGGLSARSAFAEDGVKKGTPPIIRPAILRASQEPAPEGVPPKATTTPAPVPDDSGKAPDAPGKPDASTGTTEDCADIGPAFPCIVCGSYQYPYSFYGPGNRYPFGYNYGTNNYVVGPGAYGRNYAGNYLNAYPTPYAAGYSGYSPPSGNYYGSAYGLGTYGFGGTGIGGYGGSYYGPAQFGVNYGEYGVNYGANAPGYFISTNGPGYSSIGGYSWGGYGLGGYGLGVYGTVGQGVGYTNGLGGYSVGTYGWGSYGSPFALTGYSPYGGYGYGSGYGYGGYGYGGYGYGCGYGLGYPSPQYQYGYFGW